VKKHVIFLVPIIILILIPFSVFITKKINKRSFLKEETIKTEIKEPIKVLKPEVITLDKFDSLSPEEKGLAIFREEEEVNIGFEDFTAAMQMILINKSGQKSIREIRFKILEIIGDEEKTLFIFDNPKDIKGTAFLIFAHKFENDDQWLYLPATKRVKRISSTNKSGSFVGSEFSYEDISALVVEKYTYKWIHDEIYENIDCYVVEKYPIDKKYSGYTKQVVWIDKKEFREWKIDYYDRKNFLLKTLIITGYKLYLDKFWKADEFFMKNHQTEKITKLIWSDYQFKNGLTDKDFNKNSLKRIK